jgi:hypothetical protein
VALAESLSFFVGLADTSSPNAIQGASRRGAIFSIFIVNYPPGSEEPTSSHTEYGCNLLPEGSLTGCMWVSTTGAPEQLDQTENNQRGIKASISACMR